MIGWVLLDFEIWKEKKQILQLRDFLILERDHAEIAEQKSLLVEVGG